MISGISRAAADQHMRTRLGSVFAARGVRDSSAAHWPIIVPTSIASDTKKFEDFKNLMCIVKNHYCNLLKSGQENWQSARSILPMNIAYSIGWDINYQALKGVCQRRLIETEQEDTVGSTVIMWDEVDKLFPLLASYLKPAEDVRRKSLVREVNAMPDILGILFAAKSRSPRWQLPEFENEIVKFNAAAADFTTIGEQTGVFLPRPDAWPCYNNFEDLPDIDQIRFSAV
jgi:thymidylate synthase ThyX